MPSQSNHSPFQPSTPSPTPLFPPRGVAPNSGDAELDLVQLLQIVRRRGLLIGGVALTVTAVIWGWTLTRTPIYRGNFRVLIESVDAIDPSQQLLEDQIRLNETVDYDTQIEVLRSPVLLRPIAQSLQTTYPDITDASLAANLMISRLRDTKVLEVSYRDPNREKIQAVLSEVAQQYLDYSYEQRQTSLQQGITFVDDQLPELRERVDTLQMRLERFRQQYSLLDPEIRGDELSTLISSVEEQRQALQTQLSQARSLYQTLQEQLATTPEEALAATALSESSRYQSLLNQIQELEAQLAIESARYQPTTPQIDALRERRDNLLPLLEAEAADILGDRLAISNREGVDGNLTPTSIELSRQLIGAANEVQMLQARSQTLARVEQDLKQEFELVPALARQYTELQRELNVATESLNRFLETRESLQIDAAQKSVPWQLIADPTTSSVPISPNVPRNLMLGAIAGLLAGTAIALMAEKLDQVFHSPEELKTASQFPLLGTIPYLPNLQEHDTLPPLARLGRSGEAPLPKIENGHANGAAPQKRAITFQTAMFFEAFRSLYTNIRFLGSDTPIRSLVISSSVPSEGKSVTAVYLARAAAVMGQRVLLVDADLRSPKHHTRLQLPNIRGLSNAISELRSVEEVVQRSALDDNLWVMTAGPTPPDPVKLLSSQRMQSLMDELKDRFDLVIYDMPPVLGFADSSLLAAHTDGLVMVVGLGKTERSAFARALDELAFSPVSVLGLVANGIRSYTTQTYGNYRYYRYYPKGSEAAVAAPAVMTTMTSPPVRYDAPKAAMGGSTRVPFSSSPGAWESAQPEPSGHAKPEGSEAAASVATLKAGFSAPWLMQHWHWAIAGAGSFVAIAGIGWLVYQAVLPDSPLPSRESAVWEEPSSNAPPSELPQLPPLEIAPPNQPESLPNPELEGSASGSGGDTAPTAADAADPFSQAVRLAEAATMAGETAQTPQEWSQIAEQWQQASALMAAVSSADARFEVARDRTIDYRNNGELARQKVLELLQPEPSADLD